MSKLPPGWTQAGLGELADFTNGKAFKKEEWLSSGIPIIRIRNLTTLSATFNYADDSHEPKYRVRHDDLLVSWSASLGVHYWRGEDAWLNQHIFKVDNLRACEKRYLKYAIQVSISDFYAKAHGMGIVHITKGNFENHLIPLPPLNEQKRIAQKLDALLAQVDTLKARIDAIPALLKRFRQSVFTAATNGDLSETWRRQRGGHEEWRHVRLADVASDFSYGSASKSSKEGAVPVLRMGNIQNCRLDWSDLVFTSDDHEIDRYRLDDGDVLFNRTNSPQLVGKTAVFKGSREAIFAGYLIRIRCSPHLAPDFLNYCLGSPAGRAYCWQVKSDGVSQSNINAKKLAAFSFRLPPIEEQQEIIRSAEQLFAFADQIEAKVDAAQRRIDSLAQSLLAKAFRGKLVPHDPNDEPASVLLERIRVQRAAAPKPKRGRKAATS